VRDERSFVRWQQAHDAGEGGLLADCCDADAKASAAGKRSRDHRAPGPFDTALDSPVIIDSSTSAAPRPLRHPLGREFPADKGQHRPHADLTNGSSFELPAVYTLGSVLGSRAASALSAPRA